MEFVTFGMYLTVIVALVLYAYHKTQEKTAERIQAMYSKALDVQQSVIQEIRLIRAQEQVERGEMAQERTNIMGTVNHLIGELRKDRGRQDEEVRLLIERLRIDLTQTVGDAAADAMGHVRGERVMVGSTRGSGG